MTLNYGLVHKARSPFIKILEKKIVQLFEAGLTDLWIKRMVTSDGIKRKLDDVGPQVLTLEHLEIGFVVWLVALAFTIPVFLVEIGHRPARKLAREFIANVRNTMVAGSVVYALMKLLKYH